MKTLRFLLIFVIVVAAAQFAFADDLDKITVTYNPVPLNVPSIVAKHEGHLEKNIDAEVHYTTFLAGYQMTEAMEAGDLDIASVMGGTSAITSKAGGRDIRLIATYGKAPRGFAVVIRADSSMATVLDLKGKRVAAPAGTEVHYMLAKALGEVDLNLKDVRFVNMLVPDAVSALVAGDVEAAVIVEPVMSKLVSAGKIKVLRDGEGLIQGTTFTVASGKFVAEHPEAVVAYLKGHLDSLKFAADNPGLTAELVAAEVKLPVPLVKKIIPKYTFAPEITEAIIADLESAAEFLYEEGIIRHEIDVLDLIEDSFIEKVIMGR